MPAGSSSAWPAPLVTMAILILAFHAAPVHKKIFSVVDYKYQAPVRVGLRPPMAGLLPVRDRRGLRAYRRRAARSLPTNTAMGGPVDVFDPLGNWLILHQQARPYESEGGEILPPEAPPAAAAPAAAPPNLSRPLPSDPAVRADRGAARGAAGAGGARPLRERPPQRHLPPRSRRAGSQG